ncbi:hypothetical protein D3C86_1223790 [compost metagenome]
MLISATCKETFLAPSDPLMTKSGPQGMMALVIREVKINMAGASMNNHLVELSGTISSLKNSLPPSASGCNKPKGPALSGPIRSCITAATLRSAQVEYAATPIDAAMMITTRIIFSKIKKVSILIFLF